MFKGMNKMWKGIALVLCLCMLPTVAFATGENTVSIAYETPSAPENVKVTVTIGDSNGALAETDVTILALRRATADEPYEGSVNVETAGPDITSNAATLQKQIAYIDQKASGQDGTVSFEFVPASFDADYASRFIDIYVGGKGVSAIKHMVVDMPNQSPTVAIDSEFVWYKGDPLVLTLSGAIVEKPNKVDLLETWAANATPVFICADDGADIEVDNVAEWLNTADNTLVIPTEVVGGRTISSISFISNTHTEIDNILAETISEEAKRAGTATQDTAGFVGGTFTATYALENPDGGFDWIADLTAQLEEAITGDEVIGKNVTGNTLTVEFDAMPNDAETHEYAFAIAVPDYSVVEKTVTATAPTKTEYDALTELPAAPEYTGAFHEETEGLPDGAQPFDPAEEADKKNQMWGKQTITLEDTIEDGLTIAWQVFKVGSDLPVEGAAGVYPLARSWTENTSYVATATVSMDGFITLTKNFPITGAGAQLGLDGANVSFKISKIAEAALEGLTATIGGSVAVRDLAAEAEASLPANTYIFTAPAITPGTHTLTVTKAGFITMTFDITVDAAGVITESADADNNIEMMAGDLVTTDASAGYVYAEDLRALLTAYNTKAGDAKYNADANFDASADPGVYAEDLRALLSSYGKRSPYTVAE